MGVREGHFLISMRDVAMSHCFEEILKLCNLGDKLAHPFLYNPHIFVQVFLWHMLI